MQLHASEWQMLHAGPHPSLLLDSTVAVKGAQAEVCKVRALLACVMQCFVLDFQLFLMSPV